MQCYVFCDESDFSSQKLNILRDGSEGVWNSNFIYYSEQTVDEFLAANKEDKVIIFACHCELIDSDRVFSLGDGEVVGSLSNIISSFQKDAVFPENLFLHLWFLTCGNANADVMVKESNNALLRSGGMEALLNGCRTMVPRCITNELEKLTCFVTDQYICDILNRKFTASLANNRNSIEYEDCHLEYGLDLSTSRFVLSDGDVVYGEPDARTWKSVLERETERDSFEAAGFTDQSTVVRNYTTGCNLCNSSEPSLLIVWKSTDPAFRKMEIHVHVVTDSKTGKKIPSPSIHFKTTARGYDPIPLNSSSNLYKFLKKEAQHLISSEFPVEKVPLVLPPTRAQLKKAADIAMYEKMAAELEVNSTNTK